MPTLDIGGRKVEVGDEFLKLSPEQQNATVEEIAGSFAPQKSATQKILDWLPTTWPVRAITGLPELGREATRQAGAVYTGNEFNPASTLGMAMVGTPLPAAMRAGERAIPGAATAKMRPNPVVTPTASELKNAGVRDIRGAQETPLDIRGQAVADYADQIRQRLFSDSKIHPVQMPETEALLRDLQNVPRDAIFTASNLQALREILGNTAQKFDSKYPKDQVAASIAIKELDKFLPTVAEKDVLAGTPAATQEQFVRGRGNYAAAQRSNDITGELNRARTGIGERAEARAQAANSGRNFDNTLRQRIESFLEKPKEVSGLNDAEIAALDRVVQGGNVRNTSRYVGNLFGGGGGIGQYVVANAPIVGGAAGLGMGGGVTGGLIGAGLGAIPVVTGAAAKGIANALAKRDLRAADELIRQRSPLFLERQAEAGFNPVMPEGRAAVLRALTMANMPQDVPYLPY